MHDEDKSVWEKFLALDPPNFTQALAYAYQPHQKDRVWTKQAEYYFEKAQMELAATYFAKTSCTFEDISLRFLQGDHFDALRVFLKVCRL